MFSTAIFEKKIYDFITKEVNNIFSDLLTRNEAEKEGVKVQRQILKTLHEVAEETNAQISYGLMIGKLPVKTFKYGLHLFEIVPWEGSAILLVCRYCKKVVTHNYAKDGQDLVISVSKFGKKCVSVKP
jgi:hypothetical protein